MTTGQRVLVGLGLVGAFLFSVAAGGYIARQLRGTSAPVVAIVSPTPLSPPSTQLNASPSVSASSTVPVTTAPAQTVVPTKAASPTPTASPTLTASRTPTPTPTPTATVALDPATAEEFATALQAAINLGDNAYLGARLHPSVIERYGAQRCQRHLNKVAADPSLTWDIQGSTGPAPWTWSTDGLDTVIDDTWTVSVRQPGADPELRDLHFAPADGTWRWFTDCGKPV